MNKTETYVEETERILNLGPQHPSTHGVLRILLKIRGEKIVFSEPMIGYLHRGIEKMAENMNYTQFIPMTDRLDYTSSLCNNLGYCLAVEKLLDVEIPERASYIRVLLAELQRIASHLIWLGTTAMDIGAFTPLFLCFTYREKVLEIFEFITGGRLTCNFIRIGGIRADLPEGYRRLIQNFIDEFPKDLSDIENLLTENRIWMGRLKGIGVITAEEAINNGLTGPMLRGSGVNYDLRKDQPYAVYDQLDFKVPTGETGDTFDRYLVRVEELRQSLKIIEQVIDMIPDGEIFSNDKRIYRSPKESLFDSLEKLAHHFVLTQEGFYPPRGEIYSSVENPRGELGFYLVSDGSPMAKRLKIRSPAYSNLSITSQIIKGMYLSDVIAFLTSIDVVLGEIDR